MGPMEVLPAQVPKLVHHVLCHWGLEAALKIGDFFAVSRKLHEVDVDAPAISKPSYPSWGKDPKVFDQAFVPAKHCKTIRGDAEVHDTDANQLGAGPQKKPISLAGGDSCDLRASQLRDN